MVKPNSLLERWDTFSKDLNAILLEFDNHVVLDRGAADFTDGDEQEQWLPKYLTGRRLMTLQLRDSSFRRTILVQTLILLHSVRHYRDPKFREPPLTEEQIKKLDAAQEQVFAHLQKIPPKGEAFAAAVAQALKREQNWILWKLDKCPELRVDQEKQKSRIRKKEDKRDTRKPMGWGVLAKLWANSDLDHLRPVKPPQQTRGIYRTPEEARRTTPIPPMELIHELGAQLNDPSMEKQYLLSHNRLFVWRASRIMARHDLHTFGLSLSKESRSPEQMVNLVEAFAKQECTPPLKEEEEPAEKEEPLVPLELPLSPAVTSTDAPADEPAAKRMKVEPVP